MQAFYFNRPDRPDRDAHMRLHLKENNIESTRFDALSVEDAGGFQNTRIRGNWFSHMNLIRLSAGLEYPALLMEDDVVIRKYEAVEYALKVLAESPDIDVMYFHGGYMETPTPIYRILEMHAYAVKPSSAMKIWNYVNNRAKQIDYEKPKNKETCIDQFFAGPVQHNYQVYGILDAIMQDPIFGSDTGCGKDNYTLLE